MAIPSDENERRTKAILDDLVKYGCTAKPADEICLVEWNTEDDIIFAVGDAMRVWPILALAVAEAREVERLREENRQLRGFSERVATLENVSKLRAENERLRDDADALRAVARRAEVLVKRILARVNFEAATTDVCEALRVAGIEV